MIRITVEIVPMGFEEEKYPIAVAEIVNDGSGSSTLGNYAAEFGFKEGRWSHAHVWGFPRQALNVWHLIYACLRDAMEDR